MPFKTMCREDFVIKSLYLHMKSSGEDCFLLRKFMVIGLPQGGFFC